MKLIIFVLIFTHIICTIFRHENHGGSKELNHHHGGFRELNYGFRELVEISPLTKKQTYEKQKCRRQTDCDRGHRDPRYRCIKIFSESNQRSFSEFNLRSSQNERICVPFRCYRDLDCLDVAQKNSSTIYKSKGCKRRRSGYLGRICVY